ncbi:CAP domain-containing protein [Embleya sp. NBC_00888]|uniref:CAP domain-containing protein n=1 Tax=Embleya sp. NBC_00888 TaxID=2975960 RepID=UPI0038686939|nr:CAP domain-containing protein [Embleya sp. NBC_00888]
MARHSRTSSTPARPRRRRARARRRRVAPLLALLALLALGGTVAGLVVSDRAGESSGNRVAGADGPLPGLGADGSGPSGAAGADRTGDGASRSLLPGAATTGRTALPGASADTTPSASAVPSAPTTSAAGTPSATASPSKPAATPSTSTPTPSSGPEDKVLAAVNEERASAGCGPVKNDAKLVALARAHSADMAARDYFDHNTPEGLTPWDRAEKAGVSYLGAENIARGQKTADAVMRAWMNSPGHRRNILDCGLTKLGVGIKEGANGPWWTQEFGR